MKTKSRKFFQLTLSLCAVLVLAGAALGQTPPVREKPPEVPKVEKPPKTGKPAPRVGAWPSRPPHPPSTDGVTTERSVAVDPNVSIKLCVADGRLRINGWQRDEFRIFVRDGSRTAVKVLEKDAASGKAVWLHVTPGPGARVGPMAECISGDSIEIDAPVRSNFMISGRTAQIGVDSVRKVSVKNVEGNIALRNVTGGISASTYQGDVAVENSAGAIALDSSTGNIMAFEVSPGQIGDLFRAKTNSGTISLQKVDHRQIEANSISGSLLFNGKFLPGGLYNFKTSNGSVRLLIPEDSSCTFHSVYGFGSFNTDVKLNVIQENVSPGGKSLVARLGSGDCTVKLTTTTGSIGIRKQDPLTKNQDPL